jgi:PKD domain
MNLRHLGVFALLCSVPPTAYGAGWVTPAATVSALGTPISAPPIVASNARGDTAVAWIDPATGDTLVSERPAGGTFSVGSPVLSTGDQFVGGLGIDDAGNVYVFFTAKNMTPAASTARVGVKPIGTGAWAVATVGAANSADPPQAPIAGAVTPDGKALAVWFQGHTANATLSKVEFSVKPAGSAVWGAKADLPGTTANGANGPRVVMNDAGEAAFIMQSQFCPGFDQGIRAATLTAANVWTTANNVHVCASGGGVASADIGISSTGTATATWTRTNGTNTIAQFSTKAIGDAAFPAAPASPGANDLSATGADAAYTAIAVAPDGETTIAWVRAGVIQERTRAAIGGAFAAATTVPDTLTVPNGLRMRAAPDGAVGVVWAGNDATPKSVIGGAVRLAGGAFAAVPASSAVDDAMPTVAADDEHNFPAAWVHTSSGPQFSVRVSVIDAAGPTISGVTFPDTATVDVPFAYGAMLTDRWSMTSGTWTFGDGSSGPLTGMKSYATGGTFTATLTAADEFGNQSIASSMVAVSGDTTPPTVTQLPVPESATVTKTALASGLPLDFEVSEGVTVTSTATIPWKLAMRIHLTKRRKNHPDTFEVGSGSGTIEAAGTVTVTIQFTDAARAKIKRTRRKIPLTITSVAVDPAGNERTVVSSVTLRPGKKRRR